VKDKPPGVCVTPKAAEDTIGSPQPGWAVRIVVDLVGSLHQAVGDHIPDYIESL
jgi:hypothetical protein